MHLRHVEWLIGEPVPDPKISQVLPYAPARAERIIAQLCVLAGPEVGQADDDRRAQRVRRGFWIIVDTARARQALLDVQAIEGHISKPP